MAVARLNQARLASRRGPMCRNCRLTRRFDLSGGAPAAGDNAEANDGAGEERQGGGNRYGVNSPAHRVAEAREPLEKSLARNVPTLLLAPPPFVCRTEDEAVPTNRAKVAAGSTIYADEAASWDALHASYDTHRVNHSVAFIDNGVCTNQAESFFSRLRRAEVGTHHHNAGPYLSAYATEMAWREDNRRVSNGEQYLIAVNAALHHGVSRQWQH